MKTVRRAWSLSLTLLLALLAGCESSGHFSFLGYTTEPTFNTAIRNVYVPIALNSSYVKNVEFDLTQAVLTELNTRSGAPRVTSDRTRADSELVMRIVVPRKSVILTNQEGETREAETAFNIEIIWRDLRPGHVGDVLSNPKRNNPDELPLPGDGLPTAPNAIPLLITPTANYVPELGGSNVSAQALLCRRAARQIVNMMEVWK